MVKGGVAVETGTSYMAPRSSTHSTYSLIMLISCLPGLCILNSVLSILVEGFPVLYREVGKYKVHLYQHSIIRVCAYMCVHVHMCVHCMSVQDCKLGLNTQPHLT